MKQYYFLLDFFDKVKEQKEALMYLKLYKKLKEHQFVVIKISGNVLKNNINKITESIAYLYKLGLFPIVIHGAGSQIKQELVKKGFKTKKINEQRITTKKELPLILSVMTKLNITLVNKINFCNGEAVSLTEDVFFVKEKHKKLGFVGEIKKVNSELILDVIDKKKIPVIAPIGIDKNGQKYNINADCAAKHLMISLKPKKLIFLTSTGGILDKQNKLISYINLQSDYNYLIDKKIITEGMLLKIKQIKELLDLTENSFSVQITSPENLINELFTIKGSGTFIKKGSEINIYNNFKEVNKEKLKKLLEKSFLKKLSNEYFNENIKEIFLEKDYKGVIIIKKLNGLIYLDKFAVIKEFQGEGIGRDLWQLLSKKYKKIFWRAKPNNEINDWYQKKSTTIFKFDTWNVYCINLNLKESSSAVNYSLNKKESFFEAEK
jgi:acetylglutamate kinase